MPNEYNYFLRVIVLLLLQSLALSTAHAQCDPHALEIPQNGVDEDCDGFDDFFLNLPPTIFLSAQQPFSLYFRNTILSKHTEDYYFYVESSLSNTATREKWSVTPTRLQVGTSKLRLFVLDSLGNTIAMDSTRVIVSDINATKTDSARLVLLGHSFFDQGYLPFYMHRLLTKPGKQPMSFHGTKICWAESRALFEGHGGQTWRWFKQDSISPFFRQGRALNIKAYNDQVIGLGKKPDYVVIYLDVNDFMNYSDLPGTTLQGIDDSIKSTWDRFAEPIIDSIRFYAPLAKIGYCMVPPTAATDQPFDSLRLVLPRISDRWRWNKIVSRVHIMANERYGNRESEGIYIIPTHLNFNSFTDFPNNDPVHPRPGNLLPSQTFGGYNLVSEAIYNWLMFCGSSQTQFYSSYRDQDGDGFGNPNLPFVAPSIPVGYVPNNKDCNDNNAQINPNSIEICGNLIDENCNGGINEDTIKPLIRCKQGVVPLSINSLGILNILASQINDNSSDQCSALTYITKPNTLSCTNLGANTVTLIGSDASGNRDSCSAIVLLSDLAPPTVKCKTGNIPLLLDQTGLTFVLPMLIDNNSQDQCTSISFITNPYGLSCKNIGINTVKLFAFDSFGNQDSCTAKVDLRETTPPVINCADKFLNIEVNQKGTFLVREGIVSLFDNCAIDSTTITRDSFSYSCADIDKEFAHTITIADTYGNKSSCTFMLFVKDLGDFDQDGSTNCIDACPLDANTSVLYTYFTDLDQDGYGAGGPIKSCLVPPSTSTNALDCDDTNSNFNPGAQEILNNAYDEDCNGVIDSTISSIDLASNSQLVLVSPNPVQSHLRVTSLKNIAQIQCFNNSGERVVNLNNLSTNLIEIDVKHLYSGFYTMIATLTSGEIVHQKWIKCE
jgi:Putative metal-binding motif/Secretion system C-terminal sorting domain